MTIAEVSRLVGLTPDTLRYYERVGLIPSVSRTDGGVRNYVDSDCRWIEFIKCMRSAGLPIDMLIKYVALFAQGEETHYVRMQMLIEQREQLKERIWDMQQTLNRLNIKIDRYEQKMIPSDDELKQATSGNLTPVRETLAPAG